MQYLSPIRLFEYCNVDYNNLDISKIKKILIAEFLLSENGIISIDGFDYTKNDILEEVEKEDFFQRQEYHILIWKEEKILNCLEKSEVDVTQIHEWDELSTQKEFVNFISPYLAEPFNKIMKILLNSADFKSAEKWFDRYILINNSEDQEIALKSIRQYISDLTRLIRNVNNTTYKSIQPQLAGLLEQPSYFLINKLPASLYKHTDELVSALINLTVAIHTVDIKYCFKISCLLTQIKNISRESQELIQSNHEIYVKDLANLGWRKFQKYISWFLYSIIAVFFATFLIGSFFKDTEQEDKSYKVTSLDFHVNREMYAQIAQDSIISDSVLLKNKIYYVLLENNPSKKIAAIRIQNNTEFKVAVYVPDSEDYVLDCAVDPSKYITVETNKPVLDLMFKIKKEDKQNLMQLSAGAFLFSDSLNISSHQIPIDSKGKILHISNPENIYDFILEINTDSLTLNNYIKIEGNVDWTKLVNKKPNNHGK